MPWILGGYSWCNIVNLFLLQTGEQVKNMAQNAVDSVKNTIGMAENNAKKWKKTLISLSYYDATLMD